MVDETTGILKIGVRPNTFPRDIVIHLTWRSLGLVLWLAMGIILLYEILTTWFFHLLYKPERIAQRRSDTDRGREEDENDDIENASGSRIASPKKRIFSSLPLFRSSFGGTATTIESRPPHVVMVLAFGISTAYGIFYSFEVVFLYVNDQWYHLLNTQLLLTFMDIFAWVWLVLAIKYRVWHPRLSPACSHLSLGIKLVHMLFNLLVEKNEGRTVRHWLFLVEDATFIWCSSYWLQTTPVRHWNRRMWIFLAWGAALFYGLLHISSRVT